MLFEFDDALETLKPVPFEDFTGTKKTEKDLEELLIRHFWEVLLGIARRYLPFWQERKGAAEADIYAFDPEGNVVLFELKVGQASGSALSQLFRYVEDAGRWRYDDLQNRFKEYRKKSGEGETQSLNEAHAQSFDLDEPLKPEEFNRQQLLRVVGSSLNSDLIERVAYWRRNGINVDFMPYRIFSLGGKRYFEFFAKPYDLHHNPATIKGVLFDTNRTYGEGSARDMITKGRIAAYGGRKEAVHVLSLEDIVFYCHGGHGIIAAAQVVSGPKQEGDDELYCDVKFLASTPSNWDSAIPYVEFRRVKEVLGHGFFWASTVKAPYLSREEANRLLEVTKNELGES